HLGLFDETVYAEEVSLYRTKMNRYGVPLDCRADYTKLDWLEWTTVLTDDPGYLRDVTDAIARMLDETPDRVPVTDWYFTSTARMRAFQARSVVGGFFINPLAEKLKKTSDNPS
ncbi:MAG: DUF1793 domain-containing protein, partial [Clostridia bacterium]|nr:DUF1793 domain-containing protein [Clostridia bacterium]